MCFIKNACPKLEWIYNTRHGIIRQGIISSYIIHSLLFLPPVATLAVFFYLCMENNNVAKCPTTNGNTARHTQHTSRATERNHRATQDAPGGRDRVSEIKKVLPEGGGVCTVGYPAPPAYFIKFETGVPFIHKNCYKSHG